MNYIERIKPFIEKARKSIKHPHFYYAVIDTEKMTIEYRRKKWYLWFSSKRQVAIKLLPVELSCMSLSRYRRNEDVLFIYE